MAHAKNSKVCLGLAALLLATYWAAPVTAQQKSLRFHRLGIEDGLSQGSINAILQDRQGFIWLGTQDGLNRFDGHRFKHIVNNPDDPRSLAKNWIWTLFEDSRGRLWVGTASGGLNLWEPETETFTIYRHDPENPTSLSNNTVRAILEDSRRRLWVGTDGGLNLFDPKSGTFQRYAHNPSNPDSLSQNEIRALLEDSSGHLWVGTKAGGLDSFDPETETFTHFRHDPADPSSLSENRVRAIFEDSGGNLWVGTYEAGLNLLDRASGRFTRFQNDPRNARSLSDNRVRSLLEDRDGTLWIATDGGLNERLAGGRGFVSYVHNPADSSSLSDDRVMTVFQDRGGLLWVGTQGGVNTWNPTTGFFATYTRNPRAASTLSSNRILSFAESGPDVLWIGTYEGLNRYDRRTGSYTAFRAKPGDPRGLNDERVMSLMTDRNGVVWVGTFDGGLYRLDEATGTFTNFRHDPEDPDSLSWNGVTMIFEDSEGVLWVGTYGGGLNRFEPETGKFIRYRHDPASSTSLSSDNVTVLHESSEGVLWVGTDGGGLNGFDRHAGTSTRVRARPGDRRALASDIIWALHEDRDGTLWIGTREGGLHRWSREDRVRHRAVFTRFNTQNGLSNDVVYGILGDDKGHLWISTNNGLSNLDPATGNIRVFLDSHGLLTNELNFGAYLKSVTGEMFFGSDSGFSSFWPDRLRRNAHVPPVVLTSFDKNNVPVGTDSAMSKIRYVELTHKDYVVSFEFAALDFTAPAKNRFAHKLEGFDTDWVELGNRRRVTYTNLDPGSYTFRVKASNNDGVWNEEGLSVGVKVIPPPSRTWWAYTLYTLAIGLVILAYTRAQARKLHKEADYSRKLEKEVRSRTRELAERNADLELANNKLQQASVTDSLTGLRNRRYLVTSIEEDIAYVDRYHQSLLRGEVEATGSRPDFLFLIFDLDGFKEVNDTYGHVAGDRVLIQVREILEATCRKSDTLIRWGGDEFLVVGRYADRQAAEILSERLRATVTEHDFDLGGGQTVKLSCSIGFAYYPFISDSPTSLNWEQVVAIADRALYIAKKSGRNAWVGLYETEKTREIPTEELVSQVHEKIDSLVETGVLRLKSSISDEEELVWAWA